MLEKLFARNRLQKRDPEENGSWRKIAEGDYQRYMFYEELFRKIVATEAALHNMEDPTEIAIGVMKAACGLFCYGPGSMAGRGGCAGKEQ